MTDRPVAEERHVERLAVEGDEEIVLSHDPRELGEERPLFRVVAREELAKNQIPIADETESDQKDGRRGEAARLDVHVEHATMAEAPEEPALRRIVQSRD